MIVLVDTSVWIEYLRSGAAAESERLDSLLAHDQAAVTWPVVTELIRGVRSKRERQNLEALFGALPLLEVTADDWVAAGENLAKLQVRGVTLPTLDALIAAVAARNKVQVLTNDRHFDHLNVARF